ncbi:hypothetical protein NODU109028_17055 [Nocardioides dubius]|uniref:Flagellar protein FliT n=1 Tax=Nocardioides dubius TaxID=317019 RepID=A0ABN1TSM6_9ACTN
MSADASAQLDPVVEWLAVLEQFERDLAAVEAVLDGGSDALPDDVERAWSVPQVSGPVPTELRERAELVAERQLAAQTAIVQRMRSARSQQAVVKLLDGGPKRPVYLDIQA